MTMKLSRKLLLTLALVLSVAMATTGTLAYLTDRDSDANVFTVGNVDIELKEEKWEPGSTLVPGISVDKDPTILNKGKNNAWVWMTIAVPSQLDDVIDLTEGSTEDWEWLSEERTATIDGVNCDIHTALYKKVLNANVETSPVMTEVTLSGLVDIDPNGKMFKIENGNPTDLNWNINTSAYPVIYVSAYAIQEEGFETVTAAYEAYKTQWGSNDNGFTTTAVTVETSDELKKVVEESAGKKATITLKDGQYTTNFKIAGGSDITIMGTEKAVLNGQIATTASNAGTLTLKGVTYNVSDAIQDSTGISQTGKSAIAIWGDQTVICEDVTFNMSLNDASAITAWWDTGVGTSIVARNCTFNCNGQRPIRATGNVTVENCTFNDPYRYAVQLTAKASTATLMDKAIINFNNNTIVDGPNGKNFVYGLQLEGADYGCHDLVINGSGNTITDGGAGSTMYYCECGKVDHTTIEWNVETSAVHEN